MFCFCSANSLAFSIPSSYNCWWLRNCLKFSNLSLIALPGETPPVTGGWGTDIIPLAWLVLTLINAFANVSAAPAKTSVTDSFCGFLGTLPENADMSGRFSLSSCKFEHILDRNRNFGASKLLPCFSLRSLNTVSTSSSLSWCLETLASESRFRFERTSSPPLS